MTEPGYTVVPLPPGTDARARAWLDAGCPPGPAPRPAASICLLRAGVATAVEVLWITRGRQLSVAPGALAFPGGAVDEGDLRRLPDDPGAPDRFAVLARAAARELEEETGHRVDARLLRPVARWVTPEHEPRRFDSTFLVAAWDEPEPDGTAVHAHEVDELGWAAPAELLSLVAAGRRSALPPTLAMLARLARAVEQAVQAVQTVPTVQTVQTEVYEPRFVPVGAVVDLVATEAVLVPVVPRAVRRADAPDGVDLLLPRHAGPLR